MNRTQLFNQSWSIMIRHRTLWMVALIGIGVATVVELIFSAPLARFSGCVTRD